VGWENYPREWSRREWGGERRWGPWRKGLDTGDGKVIINRMIWWWFGDRCGIVPFVGMGTLV